MESDTVRTVGGSTVVDIWVKGKVRSVSVPRAAIMAYLAPSPDEALALSDEDRREFVRNHLTLVAAAAAEALETDRGAASVTINAELLRKQAGEPLAKRRQAAGR
jgi:hypothetical protein